MSKVQLHFGRVFLLFALLGFPAAGYASVLPVNNAVVKGLDSATRWNPSRGVITVNSVADSQQAGDSLCTLREAITNSSTNNDFTGGDCAAGSEGSLDTIVFAIPGSTSQTIQILGAQLPDITDAVLVDGSSQGCGNGRCIEIDMSLADAGAHGLVIVGANSIIQGLIINGVSAGGSCILIRSSFGNGNIVRASFLGTDRNGTVDKSDGIGILIDRGSSNLIGGSNQSDRNLISGNQTGVRIINGGDQNVIAGNTIGLSWSVEALGNSENGIEVIDASETSIGGNVGGAGNIISANGTNGVRISGTAAVGNRLQGNHIGIDPAGRNAFANGLDGVVIEGGSTQNRVGTSPGGRNTISGNARHGLLITSNDNVVEGNIFGADIVSVGDLGNGGDAVRLEGTASGNRIGAHDSGNLIMFNVGAGITVAGGTGNTITENRILLNGGLGIDLGDDGVTSNDPLDGDTGPNSLQNFAEIDQAVTVDTFTVVDGTLSSLAGTDYKLEFFSNLVADPSGFGEGRRFLDSLHVVTDASGSVAFRHILSDSLSGELVTITATDEQGSTSEFSEAVVVSTSDDGCFLDAEAPLIGSPTNGTATAGQSVDVSVPVTDNIGIFRVSLEHRAGGGSSFSTVDMSLSGDQYVASIPATDRGVEYRIKAVDDCSLSSDFPLSGLNSILVDVPGEGLVAPAAQPGGTSASAYRLVSFPLDLTSTARTIVVEDDLGSVDPEKWRMFALNSNQTTVESPSTLQAGRGFWLISADGVQLDTGPGKSFPTDAPFAIPLNAGWTFIGNPFSFDVPASHLTLSSGESLDIRTFTGTWVSASSIRPFVGYAVSNESLTSDQLMVDPELTSSKSRSPSLADRLASLDWSVTISATVGDATDSDNLLGVSDTAVREWDELDRPEPPVIGDYVSVYFPHDDWDKPLSRFRTDVRSGLLDGDDWPIRVESSVPGKVSVLFDGLHDVPAEYELWLVDDLTKSKQNLREVPNFEFVSDGRHATDLRLFVGASTYVKEAVEAVGALPSEYALDPNFPNPFSSTTSIRYGLPESGTVTLTVHDLLGRRVATLRDGVREGDGFHVAVWDGLELDGRRAASGLYVYQLRVEDRHVLTGKMMLLK